MPSNRPALCGCGGAAVATAQGCIASWPGTLPAGSVCDATVLTMDLLPTFARLAGATTPAAHAIDGIDVMPILRVDAATSARILHWRFADGWAVREGPWKLLGEHDAPTMLVNLIDDLGENHDRLAQEPERAERLMSHHREWTAAVGVR